MEKDIKKVTSENLDKVAGGAGESDNPWGVVCPKCGSLNVTFQYEHDEIGVFDCNNCYNHFSKRY